MPVTSYEEDVAPSEALLSGKLESVKPLIDALNCIYSTSHKGQDVTITQHSQGGLRFTVEETGALLASVILPSTVFGEFHCNQSSLCIRLNLSLLLDCLNVFGGDRAASAHVWYNGEGFPLMLRLRDDDADTVCELSTLCDEGQATDFQFHAHRVPNVAIVDSVALRDAISELDYCGATTAELRMAPVPPRFRMLSPARSVASDLHNDIAADALCVVELADPTDRATDTFQSFQSARMQCGVYPLVHLRRCAKALALSESCQVQMNDMGMLSIMCRMQQLSNVYPSQPDRMRATLMNQRSETSILDRCFVEFIIVAQEIDEDEDEGEDEDEDEAEDVHRQQMETGMEEQVTGSSEYPVHGSYHTFTV